MEEERKGGGVAGYEGALTTTNDVVSNPNARESSTQPVSKQSFALQITKEENGII